jgi:glycerate 2-kinase
MTTSHEAARSIFHGALTASSIPAAFDRKVDWDSLHLDQYDRIHAIAVGKAALPMLETLASRLPYPLAGGVCCGPTLPSVRLSGIDYYTGGHPLPNEDSFRSAQAALQLLQNAGPRDFVFFLISGGGSAMFELPLDSKITLEETQVLYKALVGSGGTIAEINTVRKHFSAVKGGRLAAAAAGSGRCSLLLSDVAPRFLDALASGLTLPDSSTVAECHEILDRYGLRERFPATVRSWFDNPALPETPSLAEGHVEVLLSSDDLLEAARAVAHSLDYNVFIDNTCDDWDYSDAVRYLLGRFDELQSKHTKLCLLSGGEVTVRLSHGHGAGGRNQQFALACALSGQDVVVLSAGSDGIDGNSPAAGAIADATTLSRAKALGIDAHSALARFDAYPLFTALGDTLITGPTHNNLRDLRILLSP